MSTVTRAIKTSLATLTFLLSARPFLHGQAAPTASAGENRYNPGPSLPMIDGNLQYAISASELFQTGLNSVSGLTETTSLSGDVEYLSTSTVHPTTLLYAGGVLFSNGSGLGTQTYQSITATQGFVGHGWAAGLSDSLSFLPQSPTAGLVGIPGVGDIGLQPVSDPSLPAQSVLTNYGKRISNSVSGNVERQLSARNSISGGANYGILRFIGQNYLGSQSLDSNQVSGQVGLNRRLDQRSSLSVNGQYSNYSYIGNATSITSRGLTLQYTRQLSRSLNMLVSAGPQWVNGFSAIGLTSTAVTQIPSRLTVQANASLTYTRKSTSASIGYSRGVNSGSGIQTGAIADTASASVQRTFGRAWSASLTGAYTHTSGLVLGDASSVYGGGQVNRRISHSFSAFGSYTGIHQSIDNSLATRNAFSGFSQVFAIGITFAPRQTRLGQF